MLAQDAVEGGLVASYTFEDDQALDVSGYGHHAQIPPPAGPGRGAGSHGYAPLQMLPWCSCEAMLILG